MKNKTMNHTTSVVPTRDAVETAIDLSKQGARGSWEAIVRRLEADRSASRLNPSCDDPLDPSAAPLQP